MLDFIFIIGTSGIGKSTLANNLLKKLKTVKSAFPIKEYEYTKPDKQLFYSWVISNGLR